MWGLRPTTAALIEMLTQSISCCTAELWVRYYQSSRAEGNGLSGMCLCALWLRGRDARGPRATPHPKCHLHLLQLRVYLTLPPVLSTSIFILPSSSYSLSLSLCVLVSRRPNPISQSCSLKLWDCPLCNWRETGSDHLRPLQQRHGNREQLRYTAVSVSGHFCCSFVLNDRL